MKHIGTWLVAVAFALPVLAGGDSSDGHTHAAPEPVVTVPMAPRTSAATEDFELVGVLEGKSLKLYLDRYATNAPVPAARIEVESGAFKAVASELSPGVYVLPAAGLANPGKHPLAISVQAGDAADLLTATLEIPTPAATAPAPAPFPGRRAAWAVGLGLLIVGAGIAVYRRRKINRKY